MKDRDEFSSEEESSDYEGIGYIAPSMRRAREKAKPKVKKDYSRAWRDINGNKAWMRIIEHAAQTDVSPKLSPAFKKITKAIKAYHKLDKTDVDIIPKRIKALQKIEKLCNDYIKARGELLQKKGHHKSTVKRAPRGHIDLWISSLAKRAGKKAGYLDKMRTIYMDKENIIHETDSPSKLKHFVKSHSRTSTQTMLALFEGTALEKVDPYHRPFEFSAHQSPESDVSPLSKLALEYLQLPDKDAKKKKVPPFFLWLEKTELHTSSRLDKTWNPKFKHNTTQVDYSRSLKTEVQIYKGALKTKEGKIFSTKELNPKPKLFTRMGSMAFIWDSTKNLFSTASHVAGRVHHSSLNAGEKVHCAGMWIVEEGKVSYISNNSGHYRPNHLSFYLCLRNLYENNLLTDKTQVDTIEVSSMAISSFFESIQERDEISDYLEENGLKKIVMSSSKSSAIDADSSLIKP